MVPRQINNIKVRRAKQHPGQWQAVGPNKIVYEQGTYEAMIAWATRTLDFVKR